MHKRQTFRLRTGMISLLLSLSATAALASTEIRVSGSSWVHDAPTRVAYQSGYFSGDGPDITVSYAASGRDSLQRLLNDEVEFALAASTPVARAMLAGFSPEPSPDDLLVLATVSLSNQTHHVLAARERGIASPKDLEGRRIGVLKGSSGEYFWTLFAPTLGISMESAKLVDIAKTDMAGSLRDGHVDALITWDPWVYRIERDLDLDTISFTGRQIYTMNWLLVTRRKHLEQYAGVARRIMRGYIKAIDKIHANPGTGVIFSDEDIDLSEHYLQAMERRIIYNLSLNWSVLIGMEQQFDWLLGHEEMAGARRPAPEQYLEPGPLFEIAPDRVLLPDIWQRQDDRDVRP